MGRPAGVSTLAFFYTLSHIISAKSAVLYLIAYNLRNRLHRF